MVFLVADVLHTDVHTVDSPLVSQFANFGGVLIQGEFVFSVTHQDGINFLVHRLQDVICDALCGGDLSRGRAVL
jgi:hypothetical protein